MKLYRKLKTLITGNKPCTFETEHGHDFETLRLGMRNKRDVAICKCNICGKNADYDFTTSKYIPNAHHISPGFKEITIPDAIPEDVTKHPEWIKGEAEDDVDGTIYVD